MPDISETKDSLSTEADSLANDPHNREYYLAQIPFTEEQKAESDLIIMDGLYNSELFSRTNWRTSD